MLAEIGKMGIEDIPPRNGFTYQYKILNEQTIVVSGFIKINDFFKHTNLTKKEISVLDGGTYYFTGRYNIESKTVRIQ